VIKKYFLKEIEKANREIKINTVIAAKVVTMN